MRRIRLSLIVGPGIVGDVDLDPGIGLLELTDIVLDGLERIVPDDEFEREILRQRGLRGEAGSHGRGGQEFPDLHFGSILSVFWRPVR